MAMDIRGSILDWDEHDVHLFLSKLGFPHYEAPIREHHITGDIITQLDADTLKEIGIQTIGQRLTILKAVYQVKLNQGIEIEPGQYVPPSELDDAEEPITLNRLHDALKEQAERLRIVEDENRKLNENLNQCMEELLRMTGQTRPSPSDDRAVRKQPSFKWAQFRDARSPTKQESSGGAVITESPNPSPQKSEYEMSSARSTQPPPSYHAHYERSTPSRQGSYGPATSSSDTSGTLANQTNRQLTARPDPPTTNPPTSISTSDNLKSFKVSLEDPAWKVLPAALKKYKINNDDWQNYAMFICYGQTERCLSYDEKPLLLFQKLKDAKKNPVFMLKHIKDIRSPIVVAQQKHAARKASESSLAKPGQAHSHNRSLSRPSKLNTSPPNPSSNGQSSWPDLLSPATEQKDKLDELGADASKYRGYGGASGSGSGAHESENAESSTSTVRQETISGISYAVAIYPYMAEQEDEFDVVVGDTFIILSRARGWWVVQRDPSGNGIVDTDTSKQGWVPAGCLLETNVPVASAIAAANAARASANGSPPSSPPSPTSKTPILPLSILSTSFPGVALMDYRKKGEEELDLVKDDLLRVFKRYNHWSYAVKEEGGDRGWVPSWFIGKVASVGQVPSTPSTSIPINGSMGQQVALDSEFRYAGSDGNAALSAINNQVSPMSSAFPPPSQSHQRTTVV